MTWKQNHRKRRARQAAAYPYRQTPREKLISTFKDLEWGGSGHHKEANEENFMEDLCDLYGFSYGHRQLWERVTRDLTYRGAMEFILAKFFGSPIQFHYQDGYLTCIDIGRGRNLIEFLSLR